MKYFTTFFDLNARGKHFYISLNAESDEQAYRSAKSSLIKVEGDLASSCFISCTVEHNSPGAEMDIARRKMNYEPLKE